jgi:nitronate monooxygenase
VISTRLTELLGVEVPLISAPMTPQAGGRLARAVSEAGAFGMLGIEEIDTEEGIRAELAILQAGAPVPFGIGLVSWVIDRRPELLDIAIDARPTLISISFGDAGPARRRTPRRRHPRRVAGAEPALGRGRDRGGSRHPRRAGHRGGGHTGSVATLPLLQIVLELTDCRRRRGGIASGRGLAAVLAAGAVGAWVGTPFLLAEEARNSTRRASASPAATRPRRSTRASTTGCRTRAGRRSSAPRDPQRVRARWTGHEDELGPGTKPREEFVEARAAQDYEIAHIYAGQSIGLLETSAPPPDRRRHRGQARELLDRW